jgi:hypothetical protein
MMEQNLGQQLATIGADTAAEHADLVTGGTWSEKAWAALARFGQAKRGQPFMTEDVRADAELSWAVPPAPDARAWGAIVKRASKAGLIRHVAYAPNKSPNCHGSPKSVWVWVG